MRKSFERGLVLALKLLVMYLYGKGVFEGTIRPTFPSWCIFLIAVPLAFYTALRRGERPHQNIGNCIDTILVLTLSLVALFFGQGENMAWKGIDVLCNALALGVLEYWWTRRHEPSTDLRANLALQGVMCLAFVPLVNNLWRAHRGDSPESLLYWATVLACESVTLWVVWQEGQPLARVYNIRSVAFSLLIVVLILRLML